MVDVLSVNHSCIRIRRLSDSVAGVPLNEKIHEGV